MNCQTYFNEWLFCVAIQYIKIYTYKLKYKYKSSLLPVSVFWYERGSKGTQSGLLINIETSFNQKYDGFYN